MAKPPRRRGRKQAATKRSINPLKVVLITGIVLIVIMVGVLLVAKSSIDAWLKGDAFRDFLVKRASIVLNSQIEMPELKWQGSEIYANSFVARGYEGAAISRLSLDGVRAKADGVANRAFRVPDVRVNRLDMLFADERVKRPREYSDADAEPVAPSSMPDWIKKYLPERVEIDEIEISSASVKVEGSAGQTAFALSGVRTTILPDFRTQLWEFKGQGGKMSLPSQPDIEVKNLALRWKGSDLYIDQSAFGIYDGAHVAGSGEIHFGEGGLMDLDFELSSLDIDHLVSEEWQERLTGTVFGPVSMTGTAGDLVYEGTINVADGEVKSLQILERIADYTKAEQFRRLPLSEVHSDFKKTGTLLELRNLVVQSDGLLRIEGAIDIDGEIIAGDLQVGVTPGTMRWIPGAERKVFVEERDGFLWAPMQVAGTLSEPKEDLSGRLIAAAGAAIMEELPAGLLNGAQKILGGEEGEALSPDTIDQGRKMLEMLTPFLKGQ